MNTKECYLLLFYLMLDDLHLPFYANAIKKFTIPGVSILPYALLFTTKINSFI